MRRTARLRPQSVTRTVSKLNPYRRALWRHAGGRDTIDMATCRSVSGPLKFCQAVAAFYENNDDDVLADTTAAGDYASVLVKGCTTLNENRLNVYEVAF